MNASPPAAFAGRAKTETKPESMPKSDSPKVDLNDRSFSAEHGRMESVSPLIRRILAPNPGPFTFLGTGTYVVGHGQVAVIDPGPELPDHIDALVDALAGERIAHILVTHTHIDHSPGTAL